jgi:SAM-dependent methyltransferase
MDKARENENTYILDAEKAAEMSRLQLQSKTFTQAMGGLLPELNDFSGIDTVLDLACGPGDWAIEMAHAHPKIEVMGIDISYQMITYANARKPPNAQFRIMDILRPLDFPSASFDLINARLLLAVLPKTAWTLLLQECYRLLRPGGIIRLTESEWSITNGKASERCGSLVTLALQRSGHSFSIDGRHIGITLMLGALLKQAGFLTIQQRAFVIDGSAGSPLHRDCYENVQIGFLLAKPYLVKMGVATEPELDLLYIDFLREMQSPDYRCLNFNLTAWANKPA